MSIQGPQKYIDHLWQEICQKNDFSPIEHQKFKTAYDRCPRHLFTPRFWEQNFEKNFSPENESDWQSVYADRPVLIYRSSHPQQVSTISQPSFVFKLLQQLALVPGDQVLELGTGSGWNAALIATLIDPGQVTTYEIIPELCDRAEDSLEKASIKNVEIKVGDAMFAGRPATYQKGIFTAAANDFPAYLFDQIAENGLVFSVLNITSGFDLGIISKKRGTSFVSQKIFACMFVPVTGAAAPSVNDPLCPVRKRLLEIYRSGCDLVDSVAVTIYPDAQSPEPRISDAVLKGRQSTFVFSGLIYW